MNEPAKKHFGGSQVDNTARDAEIRYMAEQGLPRKSIATHFCLTRARICQIIKNKGRSSCQI